MVSLIVDISSFFSKLLTQSRYRTHTNEHFSYTTHTLQRIPLDLRNRTREWLRIARILELMPKNWRQLKFIAEYLYAGIIYSTHDLYIKLRLRTHGIWKVPNWVKNSFPFEYSQEVRDAVHFLHFSLWFVFLAQNRKRIHMKSSVFTFLDSVHKSYTTFLAPEQGLRQILCPYGRISDGMAEEQP